MASLPEDVIHKQSFSIDDLAARSVTLYPTRAAVVRDIEDVTIHSGHNEITIHNLTPQADENSIKVEGHGTDALITDMTVDLVPNYRYSEHSDDFDSDDDEDEEELKNPELEQLKQDIKVLVLQIEDADESRTSAMKQLSYLDQYVNSLTISRYDKSEHGPSVEEMSEKLESYSVQRRKIYSAFIEAQAACVKLNDELKEKNEKKAKVQTKWDKARKKADRAKEQSIRQRMHERREKKEQQLEVPQFVYRIRITIESNTLPKSTNVVPSSVATGRPARKEDDEPPSGSGGPSLRISYITSGASWTPRYDLRLDTTSGTGTLTYRAHFFNRTGEIWRNAKLTLSTSRTAFSGLEDKCPYLETWRITTRKRGSYGTEKDGGMYSIKEKEARDEKIRKLKEEMEKVTDEKPAVDTKYFDALPPIRNHARAPSPTLNAPPSKVNFGQPVLPVYHHAAYNVELKEALDDEQCDMDSIAPQSTTNFKRMSQLIGRGERLEALSSVARSRRAMASSSLTRASDTDPYDSDSSEDDADTLNAPQKMGLASSASESYGLTTTYDIPGFRTIPPSKLVRRHVITEITLQSIEFYHISVPKLRAAAFLKACIRNPSSTPLLRGPAGLTLDGSFLGNCTIPRCAPDGTFELGLGVDEEIIIEYKKPVRKVSSQGMLLRERVVTYDRCVRIHNAHGKAVKLVLFDQVPVSEEDRLRILISKPRGLKAAGDKVKVNGTGEALLYTTTSGGGKSSEQSTVNGYVQGEVRKGGEIKWEVLIEAGKDVVLPLGYEARLPSGEVIIAL